MPRRIDIELTSANSDGSWTWRAAGALKPKGMVDAAVIPDGSSVGDILKVEAEQMMEGMEILSVVKGREKPGRALLELIPDEKPFEAVIETKAKRGRNERPGGRDGDRDRKGRGRDGDKRGGRDGDSRGGRDKRDGSDGAGRSDRPKRPHFEAPPEVPQRPKAKRLRPGKARRQEVLANVPEEQRPIAELALQGMAAVRTRVKEENVKLKAADKPEMPEASVVKMAEEMLPKLRVADWLDRAEAALRQIQHLDLRDLRSVVAASADSMIARDESTRAITDELKAGLVTKQAEEMSHWLEDVEAALGVGRVIRALRLSSQPPKAGVMFPPELARRLGEAATASLLPDDSGDRWSAVLEAAAFSPVRSLVAPTTPPTSISDDLKKTVVRLGPLLPHIASLLGIEVPAGAKRPKPLRPTSRKDAKKSSSDGRDAGGGESRRDAGDGRGDSRGDSRGPRSDRGGRDDRGGRGRDDRGGKRGESRGPKDRPKGMRDVAEVMAAKKAAEAAAVAEAEAAVEAAAAAAAEAAEQVTSDDAAPADTGATADASAPVSDDSAADDAASPDDVAVDAAAPDAAADAAADTAAATAPDAPAGTDDDTV